MSEKFTRENIIRKRDAHAGAAEVALEASYDGRLAEETRARFAAQGTLCILLATYYEKRLHA